MMKYLVQVRLHLSVLWLLFNTGSAAENNPKNPYFNRKTKGWFFLPFPLLLKSPDIMTILYYIIKHQNVL